MAKVAVLTCVLGNFDKLVDPLEQTQPFDFHRWTDENFPPIAQWDPRLQYRIPKTHGWQMLPGYDTYVWLDGSMSLTNPKALEWLLDKLGDNDIALFKHPWRDTVKEEVQHIDDYLNRRGGGRNGQRYMLNRYKNGLHKQQFSEMLVNGYVDNVLYASMAFIYRNTPSVQDALKEWWYQGTRYYSCDQIVLPWVVRHLKVAQITEDVFNNDYVGLVSSHK